MSEKHPEPRFRLKNREVFDGYVFVSDEEYRVLLAPPPPPRPKRQYRMPKKVRVAAFPPCIKEIGRKLALGINLTHEARFLFVSFLLGVGLKAEEIVDLFANSPDYSAKHTEYQVGHISGAEYKCPSCRWARDMHLCMNCGDTHPMRYYRREYNPKPHNRDPQM